MTTASTTTKKPAKGRRAVPAATTGAGMSDTASRALLGDVDTDRHPVGTLVHLDPATLALEENTRKDVGMTPEFAADVAEHGVLNPLLAHYDLVGKLLVHAGQRRLLAAMDAGTPACATVPVYITQPKGDRAERISEQDRENRLRASLTVVDQTATWQELALFARDAESLAKKQRAPLAQVKAALAVAGSKVATETAKAAPDLTLDQLATLAEFDDHPDRQKDLRKTATRSPGEFEHAAQHHRDELTRGQVRAAAVAQAQAAGVPVIEQDWYSIRGGEPLYQLLASGKKLTEAAHRACPGHAAFIYVRPGAEVGEFVAQVEYGCTAWAKHGHTHTYKTTAALAAKDLPPEEAEKAKAERRAVRTNNQGAESAVAVRRRFVIDLLQRKTLPDDAPQAAAEILARHRWEVYGHEKVFTTLLDDADVAKVGKSKRDALAWLLAAAFSRVETGMAGTAKDWWRHQDDTRIAYLKRLKSWGYPLSGLEAAYVANKVKDFGVDQ